MHLLKALQYLGGFPARKIGSGSAYTLDMHRRKAVLVGVVLFQVMLMNGLVAYIIACQVIENSFCRFETILPRIYALGSDTIDMICLLLFNVSNALTSLCILTFAVRRGRQMETTHADLAYLMEKSDVGRRRLRAESVALCWFLALLFAIGVLVTYIIFSLVDGAAPWPLGLLYTTCYVLTAVLGLLSPPCAGVALVACQAIGAVATQLKSWADSICNEERDTQSEDDCTISVTLVKPYSSAPSQSLKTKVSEAEATISTCESILSSLDSVNAAFGEVLFFDYAKCLLSQITTTIFVLSAYKFLVRSFPLDGGVFYVVTVLLCALELIFETGRMHRMIILGQDVLDQLAYAKSAAMKYTIDTHDWLPERQKLRISLLRSRLESCRGVVPWAYFVLGKESALAALGVIVTYVVILLQYSIGGTIL